MLEFWAFDLVTDLQFATKIQQLDFLEKNGFCVVPHSLLTDPDKRNVKLAVVEMNPANFAYPVDGLIMEYNDVVYGKSLGSTGHHENRLIALKWKRSCAIITSWWTATCVFCWRSANSAPRRTKPGRKSGKPPGYRWKR